MELFPKIVNNLKSLTVFAKSFIFDVWLSSECAPAYFSPLENLEMLKWDDYINKNLSSLTKNCQNYSYSNKIEPLQNVDTHPVITIKKSSMFHLSPKYAFFPNTPRATIFKIISSAKKENTICSRVSKTLHWSVKHSLSKGLYKASMIQLMTITKITIRSNHLDEV